jgi:hypothetical protein
MELVTDRIMHLLTQRSRGTNEKMTVAQLVKKFPASFGIRMFIAVFTRARHLSLSWASWIQSTLSHPRRSRYILLILSSQLRICLPSGLLLSGFPDNTFTGVCSHLPHACHMPHPFHSLWFDHPNNIWWQGQIKSPSCNFPPLFVPFSLSGKQ